MSELPRFEIQEIGMFLRQQRLLARREQFSELDQTRRRHVPHLTQAELASLAKVSPALIGQIESGRYPNLNRAVVQRIGQALRLSSDQLGYLLSLFDEEAGPPPASRDVPPSVRSIVDSAEPNPMLVISPRFDVLYWNDAASRMLGDFNLLPLDRRNVVISMFTIPEMRQWWQDWDMNARLMVATLRMISSQFPGFRSSILQLAYDLGATDPLFARWWREVDPEINQNREKDFLHPRVGMLHLYQTVSWLMNAEHLAMIQFTARDEETRLAFTRM